MIEELPLRIEAAEIEGADQFRVTNAAEISSIARQLADSQEIACLYVDESERFALSAILAAEDNRILFDVPTGELRSEVLASDRLLCVSSLQRVKLQFEVQHPRLVDWQGKVALAVTLPRNMLRIQRRDFYRLTVPLGQPLSCFVPSGQGDDLEISLIDISVGGIGILGYVPGLRLVAGGKYHGVRIELPDTGTVVGDIEIRSSFDVTLKNGIRTVRIGARFLDLPSATQSLIQRYITRIERERIAR
jgi:c-di-GMP-binding flagellar brake protein YcgR